MLLCEQTRPTTQIVITTAIVRILHYCEKFMKKLYDFLL